MIKIDANQVATELYQINEKIKFLENLKKEKRKLLMLAFDTSAILEGQKTFRTEDFKFTIVKEIDRVIESEILLAEFNSLPPHIKSAFRFKPELNKKEFKLLAEDGSSMKILGKYITTRETKETIKDFEILEPKTSEENE